jgi:ribosomal protein S18 acetylase RimI-like enzyme
VAFDPLDNAVWHALTGPRRALGEHRPRAARFAPEVSPFAAVVDEPDAAAWADLRDLIGPEGVAVLFRRRVEPPESWETLHSLSGVQMVAVGVSAPDTAPGGDGALAEVVELGAADVPEMLDLVAATQPGPFGTRTVEFGGYVGVRRAGRLVAMAGERLRLDGHTELSAVCTDERYRGQGLAGLLVRVVVHRVRERGETAFLHAASDNESAIRLYDALGFETRALVDADVVRAPAD